ncbi:oligopeptide/dipeptide ABC transporter ATP-binding protein [Methylobacterium crusticola]|uniref:oligopeptide/dipeptide ABC transporter ATP-binding protein n=1 Tax=Methylobacterium crusticola TaxID=1697972 RepID=UPI00193A8F8D
MEEGPADALFHRPAHPYTRALIEATPTLKRAGTRDRTSLSGDLPSPLDPPSGCVFRTRCPAALPACAATVPNLDRDGVSGRAVACIRAGEV